MPDTGPPQEGLGDATLPEYNGGKLIGARDTYRPKKEPAPEKKPVEEKKSKNNKSAGLGPRRIGNFKYSHAGAVKTEFLFGLVLLLLAPVGNPNIKIDKSYAKRLVAYLLLFMGLFPMGASSNPEVSRLGSLLGGLVLLSLMLVSHPTKGYALNFATLIETIVAKLQPDAAPIPAGTSQPNPPKGWQSV